MWLKASGGKQEMHIIVGYTVNNQASLVAQMAKNPPAGNLGSIPGLGRFPGEGAGYPLQYSSLENPMIRRAEHSQPMNQT